MIYKKLIRGLSICAFLSTSWLTNSCRQTPVVTQTNDRSTNESVVTEVAKEPIAAKISDTELTVSELNTLTDRYIITDSSDLNSITKEIIFQQLVFKEAIEQGYGKDSIMLNELETYKNIIYEDYQEDSILINDIAFEAYQHLQNEVEVAHILFYVSEFADPTEIARKKEEAQTIFEQIKKGSSFEQLAKSYSDDRNTAEAGGYMGWYTGLQLLYPLEQTAYNLKVGEVSEPVQSKYGFHLVKLVNKRPSRGRVKVKHLLRIVPDNNEVVKLLQKSKIDSIKNLSISGIAFDTLVSRFSDDFRTRENGGVLPEFWIGSREEKVVEEAVFKLNVEQISEPVLSSAGWHLFKLVEKNAIPSWPILRREIISKVTTDSRGEYLDERWVSATKTALGFKPNVSVINATLELGDQNLLTNSWKKPQSNTLNSSFLFSVKGESVSVGRFLTYVETFQGNANLPKNYTPEMAMRYFYKRFEASILKEYGKRNLQLVNPSFKVALQSYYESLVTKNFLNDNIYSKSLRDSVGLQNFYARNIQNFQYSERAKVIQLTSQSQKAIDIIEAHLATGKPYNLNRGITPTLFVKNSTTLEPDEKNKLYKLILFLKRNPQYLVEIGGHADVNEEDYISAERVKIVTNFLTENGLSLTRIKENDFGKTQPANRFDWQKNQRITYRFFSNSIADIERLVINQGFEIEIQDETVSKEDLLAEATIDWEIGSYSLVMDDGYIKKIIIEEIYPARTKTYREARAAVINGYQAELEEKLHNELLKKYPVEINQNLLNDIYRNKILTN